MSGVEIPVDATAPAATVLVVEDSPENADHVRVEVAAASVADDAGGFVAGHGRSIRRDRHAPCRPRTLWVIFSGGGCCNRASH